MPGIQETRLVVADQQQRRHPSSLQGLFNFCVETTASEDAPNSSNFQPMDEERRAWLSEALQSMTTNVIQILDKAVKDLKNVEQVKAEDSITLYESAIETILDHIDQIDTACDFHKIGGFVILGPCLKSQHPKIRAGGCEILATLCQNNPYCQDVAVSSNFLPGLLKMVEVDEDLVVLKVLSAVSAIVQNHSAGYSQFIQNNGPQILLKALDRSDDRIIRKITFMLNRLCVLNFDLKNQLVSLNYIPILIVLFRKDDTETSRSSILSLLACLSTESTAMQEIRKPEYNLKEILITSIETHKHQEDYLEEVKDAEFILTKF